MTDWVCCDIGVRSDGEIALTRTPSDARSCARPSVSAATPALPVV
jgi:hypothetical protein